MAGTGGANRAGGAPRTSHEVERWRETLSHVNVFGLALCGSMIHAQCTVVW